MVDASNLYGSPDFRAGVPLRNLGNGGITSGSTSGSITIASGQGILSYLDVYGIAQSASSGMSSGMGFTITFTFTADGNAGATVVIKELFPFLGTGETSVIKSDKFILPINMRFNNSFTISWTSAVQSSRIQSTYLINLRADGVIY
jgi:hypothetical protein